jgi:hypothetical protein
LVIDVTIVEVNVVIASVASSPLSPILPLRELARRFLLPPSPRLLFLSPTLPDPVAAAAFISLSATPPSSFTLPFFFDGGGRGGCGSGEGGREGGTKVDVIVVLRGGDGVLDVHPSRTVVAAKIAENLIFASSS